MNTFKGLLIPMQELVCLQKQSSSTITEWIVAAFNDDNTNCIIPLSLYEQCSLCDPKCSLCVLDIQHIDTLLKYLIDNKHLNEGDALQITLDTKLNIKN